MAKKQSLAEPDVAMDEVYEVHLSRDVRLDDGTILRARDVHYLTKAALDALPVQSVKQARRV